MGIKILGSTSGSVEISAPAVAGNNTQYTLGNNSGMLIGTNDPDCVDGNMLSSTLDFKGKTLQSWPFGKNLEHAITYNYDVTAVTGAYVFGNSFDRESTRFGNNVALTVYEGDTVNFNVNAAGHPFYLKTTAGTGTGNQIAGVTNNGADVGTVSYTFPAGSSGTYYYQCSAHAAMFSTIVVSTPSTGGGGSQLITPGSNAGAFNFASMSMNEVNFANLPSNAKRSEVDLAFMINNTAGTFSVQLGTATDFANTYYSVQTSYGGASQGGVGTSYGFGTGVPLSIGSSYYTSGRLVFTRYSDSDTNLIPGPAHFSFAHSAWTVQGTFGVDGYNHTQTTGGRIHLGSNGQSKDPVQVKILGPSSGQFTSGYVRVWTEV